MRQLLADFERGGIAVCLLDNKGTILYPDGGGGETDPAFATLVWENGAAAYCAYVYCRIGGDIIRFAAEDQARALVLLMKGHDTGPDGQQEAPPTREALMMRILNTGYTASDEEMEAHGIDPEAERCAISLSAQADSLPVLRAMNELFADSPDIVLPHSNGRITIIKSMRGTNYAEMIELCRAMQDSVLGETGQQLTVSVGEPRRGLSQITESFREAVEAMEVGLECHPKQSLFQYRRLIVERFLREVAPSVREKYRQTMFSKRYTRLFTEEMLNTIDTFFACSLNLSEAARQLYIHRNTLVYRLDKFQNATGLDLRIFDDAVALKLLRMMGDGEVPVKKSKRGK